MRENACDTPYWGLNSNGIFTIKSIQNLLASNNKTDYSFQWIWSLNTLHKIKHFLWLCSHNRLPTNSYLHHLGIITDPSCPICHNAVESTTHTLLECHLVKKLWLDMGLNMYHIANTHSHWLHNLHNLDIPLYKNKITWKDFYPFALWYIWLQRNHTVFRSNNPMTTPSTLFQLIMVRVSEFKHLSTASAHDSSKIDIRILWFPPPVNFYKLNIDGAFIKKDQTGGLGGVIRDSNGSWVFGFCKKIIAFSHTLVELQAFELGLQLAFERGMIPLEIETDLTEVIEFLHHSHPIYLSVLDSCRSLLRRLGNPMVRHHFRQANKLADFLAKEGCNISVINYLVVLVAPPEKANIILRADKDGVSSTRSISLSTCTKLATLGNLSVMEFDNHINRNASNIVTTTNASNNNATRDANSIISIPLVIS
ncbi:hypothetical protein R3W88_005779 [Solanum pinnatisectum]|uniref:RNase H type-1 domain-containing protein n=1 Tax=Solanum pinnatisectum TaxID=50273 RepID=A0AAV9KCW4_9SOLN|nr:hypothetical protein R3W88_005779 [Solanum pinnatisectum]